MYKFIRKSGAAALAAAMVLNSTVIVSAANADAAVFEFEDAVIDGDITVESDAGASGGSYLKMTESGTITLTVSVSAADLYELKIYAGGIGSAKQQNISVNGTPLGSLAVPASEGFEEIVIPSVKLNAGDNTLVIEKSWGWTNFDYLTVETASLPEITASQTTPCDPLATAETRSLMNYLSEVYGNHIISGQQEIYNYGPHDFEYEFEYLEDLTGHMPAIRGFDFGNFCCPAFGSDDGSTDRVIDWVKNRNGIATSSFHLNVPTVMENYTIGDRIDFSATTYSQNTDFSPSKVVEEGTKENLYYMQALETLAAEFGKLQDEGIPVIWRPLHEAEGGGGETASWFWWGREGSQAYKDLWIFTYKTLTEDYGLHNLIWEWNSYDFSTSADWYPGDEYVDIIGYDKYSCTDWSTGSARLYHNDSPFSSTFYSIMQRYNNAKMVSMAENDCFSTLENITSEKAGWLYFCTWYDGGSSDNNFLTDPLFNTEQDTIDMYRSDYCITLDELPDDLYTRDIEAPPVTTTTNNGSTTTTTTTVTEPLDPTTQPAKVSKTPTGNVSIVLPEPSDKVYLQVEIPDDVSYANGGLGVSIELEGEYYWANIQWETRKTGDVEVDLAADLLNVSLGEEVVEDEAIIEAVKEALTKQTKFEGQVWYAADKANDPTDTDGVVITGAYIKKTDEDDIVYGDTNCDGDVNLADAVLIMQYTANPDTYGLGKEDGISEQGAKNADVTGNDGITNLDALTIQKFKLGLIEKLPE